MLKKLRENMKMILWITIIAFVALIFLAWGMDIQSGRGPSPGTLAKVNGYTITRGELDQAVRNTFDTYRQQFGRDPSDAQYDALRDQAWANLVQRILISQEAERRGMAATDEEVVYSIRMDPPQFVRSMEMFQTDGVFDPQKFREGLSDPLMDWTALEQWVRATLPLSKVQDLVVWGAKVSEEELREAYDLMNETRTISYMFLDPMSYSPNESLINDELLRDYYSENKGEFIEPEQARLSYVFLELKPSASDTSEVLNDLTSILDEIRGGEDIAELAQIHSEGPYAEQGGDPGRFFKRGDLNSVMEERLFSMEVGQVTGPFLDASGYHLVKLEEKETLEGEEQVKFRNILRTVTPSQATINALWDKAQRIATATAEDLTLAEAAAPEGLQATETPPFMREGVVPGLAGLPEAKEMAFKMRRGEVRGPLSTYRGHYFIELLERKDERQIPFNEAREDCRDLLLKDMRSDLAFERASALARAAMDADSLQQVAEAESLEVASAGPFTRSGYVAGLGRDLTLVGAAFAASPDDPPFAVKGDRGSYVVSVDSAEETDPAAFESQKESLARSILQQRQGLAYTAWISALEEGADIKDFRERF